MAHTKRPPALAKPAAKDLGLNNDRSPGAVPPEKQETREFDWSESCRIACWTETARDLLAESVELTIGYGVNILAAIRRCDDAAVLDEFAGFDASARTARHSAEKLREKQRFLERGRR